jgi:ADP-ribose pyrophosphatase YjhB (NUDIX family)
MRVVHTRFTVTAGAIVTDDGNRVLLLKHRFRGGSGWGIPGGFIEAGEHPHEAIKRELCEEVGLDVGELQIIGSRTFTRAKQIEILYRCRAMSEANPRSSEIKKAEWFSLDNLPDGLPKDQKQVLQATLIDGANPSLDVFYRRKTTEEDGKD